VTRHWFRVIVAFGLAGCATARPRLAPLPTSGGEPLGPGLSYHHVDDPTGPWAIDLLEVDRTACWSAVAVKAGAQAIGRARTSALARQLADTGEAVVGGAVNADFFRFDPPGVPTGPHLSGGRVVTGPGNRPAVWFGRDASPQIGFLKVSGTVTLGTDSVAVAGWNRPGGNGVLAFDANWGTAVSRPAGVMAIVLDRLTGSIREIDSLHASVPIPVEGVVLLADATARQRLSQLRVGDPATWQLAWTPATATEVVGGFPVLVRDSQVVEGLAGAGGANFGPARHPRTAVGIASNGRRLLLVTVDGRREGWSAGMTLVELAELMRQLGATEALNLDGGGSTTMVARRAGRIEVVNRPSDATGERPVANVLAVVRRCG
jgi:hypothetical protein